MDTPLEIALVVEDVLSCVVMEKLLTHTGRNYLIKRPLVERGSSNIRRSIPKYLSASHALPHVVLTDLDLAVCAPALRQQWCVATIPDCMLFRVAVREVEAWLLADRPGFSTFARIPQIKISQAPESLTDPKQELINLVRHSRNRRLAVELVPAQGSSVSIGPMYNERMCGFVRESWNVSEAMNLAPSLQRTVDRLHAFLR